MAPHLFLDFVSVLFSSYSIGWLLVQTDALTSEPLFSESVSFSPLPRSFKFVLVIKCADARFAGAYTNSTSMIGRPHPC
jgi:hypothetical protein